MIVQLHTRERCSALFLIKELRVGGRTGHEKEAYDAEADSNYAFDEENPRPSVVSTVLDLRESCRQKATEAA